VKQVVFDVDSKIYITRTAPRTSSQRRLSDDSDWCPILDLNNRPTLLGSTSFFLQCCNSSSGHFAIHRSQPSKSRSAVQQRASERGQRAIGANVLLHTLQAGCQLAIVDCVRSLPPALGHFILQLLLLALCHRRQGSDTAARALIHI